MRASWVNARPGQLPSIGVVSPTRPGSGQWLQGPLVVVLQPDADVGTADGGDLLGHQRAHQAGRHEVCPVEQGAQHALAEALGAGPALLVDEAHSRPGRRCLYRDGVIVVCRRPASALQPGSAPRGVTGRRPRRSGCAPGGAAWRRPVGTRDAEPSFTWRGCWRRPVCLNEGIPSDWSLAGRTPGDVSVLVPARPSPTHPPCPTVEHPAAGLPGGRLPRHVSTSHLGPGAPGRTSSGAVVGWKGRRSPVARSAPGPMPRRRSRGRPAPSPDRRGTRGRARQAPSRPRWPARPST